MSTNSDDTTLSAHVGKAEDLTLEQYYLNLTRRVESVLSVSEDQRNRKYNLLGRDFLRVAATGVPDTLKVFLDAGMPVSYRDPQTGETALHAAAASGARKAIRVLLDTGECDFLIRDAQGRFPSELADLYGRDTALARLLGMKERKQADSLGIKLTRRPLTTS